MRAAMSGNDSIPSAQEYVCRCDIEVRFSDLDAMGHVNNAAYITYFEIARTHLMQTLGRIQGKVTNPAEVFPFILLDVSCRFLAPVAFGQHLVAHIRTGKVGTKSFAFHYLLTDRESGQAVATGESMQVYYDYAAGRSDAVPPEFRAGLERFAGPVST